MKQHTHRNAALLLALILTVTTFATVTPAYGAEAVTLQMNGPADMTLTDFDADYALLVNGENYSTMGCPFLHQDYTYFPIRDLSDIYGFEVQYNESDRTVVLTSTDKLIALAPGLTLYDSGSLIRTAGQADVANATGYLTANDRSYIPLRLVSELFGFQVDYDTESHTISISGQSVTAGSTNAFFSDEQLLVIDALKAYEAANTLAFSGTVDFLGEKEGIQAALSRKTNGVAITRTIYVDEQDNDQFKGITITSAQGTEKSVYEMNKDGSSTLINLHTFAGLHPYNELDMLRLCGLAKYGDMQVEHLGSALAGPQYKVTMPDSNVVLTLTILNGKLVGYREEIDGDLRKELAISYGS